MYNRNQCRFIARELARSGRHIPGALEALHQEYESFRTLSETTVRKLLKDEDFRALLMDQEHNLAFAQEATQLQAEKARARAEALRDNPLRQILTTVVAELHELAKTNPGPRTYEVLLAALKLLRSLEPAEDDK